VLSLHDLQHAFVQAVLWEDAPEIDACILGEGITPARRLQIYRNNAREGFTAALRATYPIIERLGGEDWFRQIAWGYQRSYPSASGDLQNVGKRFPMFLESELRATPYAYFIDVARLEWAYQEVLIAVDGTALDFTRLQSVPESQHAELRFTVNPAVRWIASRFPILEIWKANRDVEGDVADISFDAGSCVAIVRRVDHVELREFQPDALALLEALHAGATLGSAAEALGRQFPEFNLGASLIALAALNLFADFSVPKTRLETSREC